MADRGSFVTEYILCPTCKVIMLEALEQLLGEPPPLRTDNTAVIAGAVAGSCPEEVRGYFDQLGWAPDVRQITPCHPITFAVFTDTGPCYLLCWQTNGTVEEIARVKVL